MSNLKVNEDQYIGKQELQRFQTFLSTDGYQKLFKRLINTYGVAFDNVFTDALKVIQGTVTGAVTIKAGSVVGQDLSVGTSETDIIDMFTVVPNGFKYIYAKSIVTNKEVGTVSIDAQGNVTGVGTKFTDVLRGQPANASKIRFINSNGNTLDYTVLNVLSDTQLVIQAPLFVAESNLTYGVVGTFSPSVVIDAGAKMIFNYDALQIVASDTIIVDTTYFALATVDYTNGTDLVITDTRKTNQFTILLNPSIEQNGFVALLNKVQTFTKTQTTAQGGQLSLVNKQIDLGEDGNSFVVGMKDTTLQYIKDKPIGTIIELSFLDAVNLTSTITRAVNNTAPSGYAPIMTTDDNIVIKPLDTLVFKRTKIIHTDSASQMFDGWVLISNTDTYRIALEALTKVNAVSFAPLNARLVALENAQLIMNVVVAPFLQKGAMVLWKKPFADIPAGWQECVDWRGRLPIGFDPNDGEFAMGSAGGSKTKTLVPNNVPSHSHALNMRYSGYRHSDSGTKYTPIGEISKGISSERTGDTNNSGNGEAFEIMNPYRVVVFIEYIGI